MTPEPEARVCRFYIVRRKFKNKIKQTHSKFQLLKIMRQQVLTSCYMILTFCMFHFLIHVLKFYTFDLVGRTTQCRKVSCDVLVVVHMNKQNYKSQQLWPLVVLPVRLCLEVFLWSDGLHPAKIIQHPHLKYGGTHRYTVSTLTSG